MPKRNLVWIAVGAVIAVLLWQVPQRLIRQDALLNQFSPLLDVRLKIRKNYVESEAIDDKTLLRGAIDGMLNRLDPYSEYLDNTQLEQFNKRTEGQFEGIGVEIGPAPGGGLVILAPIEGSPAFRAGLQAGDRVTQIDGQSTENMPQGDGARLISGAPGTSVTLTILRPGTGEILQKTITRGVITFRTVRGWARTPDWEWDYLIDPRRGIGYIRISSFEGRTGKQFDDAMRDLLTRCHIRGLVVDVRDNPGGLLPVVVEIANRFMDEGVIVSTKGPHTYEQPFMAVRDRAFPSLPTVVLVNHGSASAAEILAGALKDHHRAALVGEQTFGKGSVQELIPLKDNSGAVKLTTKYYYLPNGERIHGKGIKPDHIVDLTPQERSLLAEAQRAVYSTSAPTASMPATTPATSTAPAEVAMDISLDRQLQEALKIVKQQVATRPSDIE